MPATNFNPQSHKTLAHRYFEKIDKFTAPAPAHKPLLGRCWQWTGYCDKVDGYGHLNVGSYAKGYYETHPEQAHRIGWQLCWGPIPDGLNVCHHCDNPACQRPDHWFLGTHVDNAKDRHAKNRDAHLKGERHGAHVLTEADVEFIRTVYPYERMGTHTTTPHPYSMASLARKFSVSKHTIWQVLHNYKWQHLKSPIDERPPQA